MVLVITILLYMEVKVFEWEALFVQIELLGKHYQGPTVVAVA